jgi:hypothetical protein
MFQTYAQEYEKWVGMRWECPSCDAATEPFEDSGTCEECWDSGKAHP